jgi:hypothetical protein
MEERIKNAQKWRGKSSNYTKFRYKREEQQHRRQQRQQQQRQQQSSSFGLQGLLKEILAIVTVVKSFLDLVSKTKKVFA